jgi:hypothetical protein
MPTKKPKFTCRLCLQTLDPEHPLALHALNPATFRLARMHGLCFQDAYDLLAELPPHNPQNYDTRQDEYLARIAEPPNT